MATIGRAALALAEVPYAAAIRLRNRRYDDPQRVERVGAVVVSVGNLTLGGTGKTPFVEWLARWFTSRGVRRGTGQPGLWCAIGPAERRSAELALSLPEVPHLQNPQRAQAARRAIAEHGAQLVLLDDGFQHRRLRARAGHRARRRARPLGFGHVFPRARCANRSAAGAGEAIALSRADLVSPDERQRIRQEVARHAPRAVWLELCTRPRGLLNSSGGELDVSALAGQNVAAFCGIGNPAGFRQQLLNYGYQLAALREFNDHQDYSPALIEDLATWAVGTGCTAAVCTRKDLVKIPLDRLGEIPLWALSIGIEVTSGLAELETLLAPLSRRAGGAS